MQAQNIPFQQIICTIRDPELYIILVFLLIYPTAGF